jgi:hypothetical protein
MQRIATVRIVLAILGVCFLLLNPVGVCAGAGIPSGEAPSHPCCPKPAADPADSPCICIDRQPASPTVPSPGELSFYSAIQPDAAFAADVPVQEPKSFVEAAPPLPPHTILLSIHQLLL